MRQRLLSKGSALYQSVRQGGFLALCGGLESGPHDLHGTAPDKTGVCLTGGHQSQVSRQSIGGLPCKIAATVVGVLITQDPQNEGQKLTVSYRVRSAEEGVADALCDPCCMGVGHTGAGPVGHIGVGVGVAAGQGLLLGAHHADH